MSTIKDAKRPSRSSAVSTQTQVVSSLFSSNPTIPTLPSTRFEQQAASNVPLQESSFDALTIHPDLVHHLAKMDIKQPTKIQTLAIPSMLNAKTDVIIQSETGSGKTLAYLLPVIQSILMDKTSQDRTAVGTCAIILTPTRELASQVYEACLKLLSFTSKELKHWLVAGMITGGDKRQTEKARLRKGVNVLVATPGRLVDHLKNSESFKVDNCTWLVLDEADRLMELGFDDAIRTIVKLLDEKKKKHAGRRTILCSATMGEKVRKLAGENLKDPITVSLKDASDITIPKQLKQSYVVVPAKLRLVTLIALFKTLFPSGAQSTKKAVVFVSCCDAVDFYHALFTRISDPFKDDQTLEDANEETSPTASKNQALDDVRGLSTIFPNVPMFRLHGNLTQPQRQASYRTFSAATNGVLLCTDVAARGLDLPNISHIIQYDPPSEINDYIHRIGRTARIGHSGESAVFLLPSELEYVQALKDVMPNAQGIEARSYDQVCRYGFGYKSYEATATKLQTAFERFVLDKDIHAMAKKAFHGHIKAYATHGSVTKHIFHPRKLHLGHVAKAFALRDAPSNTHAAKPPKKRKEMPTRLVNHATGNEEFNVASTVKRHKS